MNLPDEMKLLVNKVHHGNSADILKLYPDESIDFGIMSPPYDCYSDDTEILTESGWMLIKDVKIGDSVCTLDPNNKNVIYQKVINNFCYKNKSKLIHFKNSSMDLLVTPNHQMFVCDRNGNAIKKRIPFLKSSLNKEETFLKKATDIKSSDLMIYQGFGAVDVKKEDKFILPELFCNYKKTNHHFKEKEIDMMWWVRFMGFYLSEGGLRGTKTNKTPKCYEFTLKQKNEDICCFIRETFQNLPFEFKEYKTKTGLTVFGITDRQLYEYLKQFGNSYQKFIPNNIKNNHPIYLKEFLRCLYIGDGCRRLGHQFQRDMSIDSFVNYKSVSSRLLDDIQECLIKIGTLSNKGKNDILTNKRNKYIRYKNAQKQEVEYVGNVVCVEVPKHNIICVRRNGYVSWCGNCLRSYSGYEFDFCSIAQELSRALKPGGVIVWVVQDSVIDGSESGTSFKQALYFKQKCGLNIHDTMIWQKTFLKYPEKIRYHNSFEYMFVFSKGKPKTINIIEDRQNLWGGCLVPGRERQADGTKNEACKTGKKYKDIGARWNVWAYPANNEPPEEITADKILEYVNRGYVILDPNGKRCDVWAVKNTWDRYLKLSNDHPAVFPEELVRDHILTWTNPGDIVVDPFGGSGTTAVMAKSMNRYYVSIDVSKQYCEDQVKRLKNVGIFQDCAQIDNN